MRGAANEEVSSFSDSVCNELTPKLKILFVNLHPTYSLLLLRPMYPIHNPPSSYSRPILLHCSPTLEAPIGSISVGNEDVFFIEFISYVASFRQDLLIRDSSFIIF